MQKIDSVTYFLKLKRIYNFSFFFHLCTSRYLIIAISLLLGDRKKCQQLFSEDSMYVELSTNLNVTI